MESREINDLAERLERNGEQLLASVYRNEARRIARNEEYERNRPIIEAMNRRGNDE